MKKLVNVFWSRHANPMCQLKEVANVTKQQRLIFQEVAKNHRKLLSRPETLKIVCLSFFDQKI